MGRTTKGKTHVGRRKILVVNGLLFFNTNERLRAKQARAARDFIPLRAQSPMNGEFLGERNFDLYARGNKYNGQSKLCPMGNRRKKTSTMGGASTAQWATEERKKQNSPIFLPFFSHHVMTYHELCFQ